MDVGKDVILIQKHDSKLASITCQ